MKKMLRSGWNRRQAGLILLIVAPLLILMLLMDPIAQDPGYHLFADARIRLGIRNFSNVTSNLVFLVVGAAGMLWCRCNPEAGAARSWLVFFLGVALVFFGSSHYHLNPGDSTLIWDRLPMTMAFMGLFAALLSEHLDGKIEHKLLVIALTTGIASVAWWKLTGDLRLYLWVQFTPLLTIAYVVATFPGRYRCRHYLLFGVMLYASAKIAEYYDHGIYAITAGTFSGHTLKHLLAALAAGCVLLMLRRRTQSLTPVASSQ